MATLINGDARHIPLADASVQCCVTSPPYWGLRDYNVDGQIGLEDTPGSYTARLVDVFREVRRVLKDDGVVFLNLGDSYYGSNQTGGTNSKEGSAKRVGRMFTRPAGAQRAQPYGNGDKAERDYQGCDCSCQSPGDEHTNALRSHTCGICLRRVATQVHESCLRIQAHTEGLRAHLPGADCSHPQPSAQSSLATLDLVRTSLRESEPLRASLVSKLDEFSRRHQADSRQLDTALAFLSSLRSFEADALRYVRMLADALGTQRYMEDTASLCAGLVLRIRCISEYCLLVLSWLNILHIQPQYTALKPKDLCGIPWRVAFALQADGWYLRSDIIWHKPNPMPESVTDRPTKAHEYIFLLAKNERYFYDAEAIREPYTEEKGGRVIGRGIHSYNQARGNDMSNIGGYPQNHTGRNRRSVWTVATQPYPGAHFATFPPALIEPCILAGSKPGDVVLDPFMGSGTTGAVAIEHGRRFVGVELNPAYIELAQERLTVTPRLLLEAAPAGCAT